MDPDPILSWSSRMGLHPLDLHPLPDSPFLLDAGLRCLPSRFSVNLGCRRNAESPRQHPCPGAGELPARCPWVRQSYGGGSTAGNGSTTTRDEETVNRMPKATARESATETPDHSALPTLQ